MLLKLLFCYMSDNLDELVVAARAAIMGSKSQTELDMLKSKFLGTNGVFRTRMKSLANLPKEDRPAAGQRINALKKQLEEAITSRNKEFEEAIIHLDSGANTDFTLSYPLSSEIFCHPLTKIRNRCIEIFSKLGFSVAEATEIDTEWFCFDALNTPLSHPSRAERDTFYIDEAVKIENVEKHGDESYLLRTQTSTVQIHTMLKSEPPIRVISPGLCFRKDTMDATHSSNFYQCEGLVVDRSDITVCDLKATLDFFFKELIGEDCEIRMRPSFFPFTSPGFEVDFKSKNIGKLSNRWIEVCGCGIVAENVFKSCDYSDVSGFAFAVGIDRLAMLLYGIDDIRLFYQNDARFLKQFKFAMA